ncbi:MAG: carbohydrate kinase family protein [Rhodospirillales bacterium]|nr:carbohydrate kinase family protein [Rhodospirillales bacterium]
MPDRRRGFVTGGTWCVDRNKLVEYWPEEDGLVQILAVEQRGGGSACNFAVDMRQLDPTMPVATIGLVGDDEDGRFLLAEADAAGIERGQLHVTAEAPTQYTDAFGSQRSGRRTHFYFEGTAALLTPAHFDFSQVAGRVFHLGLPGLHRRMDAARSDAANGWVATLRAAHAAGLLTSLELASIAPERIAGIVRPCLPHLDFLIVNDVEIGALAGAATLRDGRTDVAACARAVQAVAARGRMRLVAAHFPAGAVALAADGRLIRQPALRVPPGAIAGANGAGDAFAAGTLYGLHEGWDAAQALALGRAAAAASLRGVSTTGTVETWQACLALAAQWGECDRFDCG